MCNQRYTSEPRQLEICCRTEYNMYRTHGWLTVILSIIHAYRSDTHAKRPMPLLVFSLSLCYPALQHLKIPTHLHVGISAKLHVLTKQIPPEMSLDSIYWS